MNKAGWKRPANSLLAFRAGALTSGPDTDEPDAVLCGGGARPTDTHLASAVDCVDEEIIEWLEKAEEPQRALVGGNSRKGSWPRAG